jgi:hypothetical protein
MKQSAVEWLVEELFPKRLTEEQYYCIEKAKEIEKQQIIEAWKDGAYGGGQFTTTFDNEEKYYNETFNNK